jgi:hypothetical protein
VGIKKRDAFTTPSFSRCKSSMLHLVYGTGA